MSTWVHSFLSLCALTLLRFILSNTFIPLTGLEQSASRFRQFGLLSLLDDDYWGALPSTTVGHEDDDSRLLLPASMPSSSTLGVSLASYSSIVGLSDQGAV